MIDQEEIYKLLESEDWKSLIDIFYKKKDLIKKDPLLIQSLETTLSIITKKAIELETSFDFVDNLETILLLNAGRFLELKEEQKEAITLALINWKKDISISFCYPYAKEYPNNEMCKTVISEYEKDLPKKFNHSQANNLLVTQNNEIDTNNDFRKSLFNSNQEVEFFLSLKRVFDSYQVYPNVGLSCILDFDNLSEILTTKERTFFFNSTVDFVILEPFRNYLPIYFFEIDSAWHDTEKQKEKDKMKDRIFSLSGQKLIRIRKNDNSINEQEFERLLKEIRKEIANV